MTEQKIRKCRCECGSVSYAVPDKALLRMFCHCTICQEFNDAVYADIFVYRASDIERPEEGLVNFDTYRPRRMFSAQSALCAQSQLFEVLDTPLLPSLMLVPGNMQQGLDWLPAAKGHVFYQSRMADMDDGLAKHSGYLKSQLVFAKHQFIEFLDRA
ncbi:MAG: hypothetical protein ACI9LU_001386 [Polaribacter sp.]